MLPQVKQVKDTNHCFLLGYKASSLLGQKGCTSVFPILCVNFMCMFCWSLFVLLSFFFWPLCGLSFDLQILITYLVS